MTERSFLHHTFELERIYAAAPDRTFAAWSDPQVKRRWFVGDRGEHTMDFRVGGNETNRSPGPGGEVLSFESRYLDIVEDERIAYSSTLSAGATLVTASITTVEFRPDGTGTRLVLVESDVFFDGQEQPAWREHGTGDWLAKLGAEVDLAAQR